MSTDSEPTNVGNTESTSEKNEEAKNTGGKSPGAGLQNTLGQSTEQRVGDAGYIAPTTPESTKENQQTTQAAFSSGTKPANAGQTQSPAETETTGTEQTGTTSQ